MPIDVNALLRLAQAEAQKESSPLGGPRSLPVRGQPSQPILQMIRDNPGSTAAILASLVPGIGTMAAAGIGAGARGVDKFHLFDSLPSEYSQEEPGESIVDIGLAGMMAGLGQYAVNNVGRSGLPEPIDLGKINVGRHLIDAPAEMGLPAGYKIFDYSKYPGMVERDAYLASIGQPRFIPGPKGSGFEGRLVGNPIRNKMAGTPEGDAYELASSFRDPRLSDDILYSGVIDPSKFDPFISTPKKVKFSSTNENTAKTYSPRNRELEEKYIHDPYNIDFSLYKTQEEAAKASAKKILVQDIMDGILDPTYPPVKSLLEQPDQIYGYYAGGAVRPTVQEFVPFHKKIIQRDLDGRHITMMDHPQQKADFALANEIGADGVIYRDAKDPGPNAAASLFDRGAGPTDVMMTTNPQMLKSRYNLGTWDLADPRALATWAALADGTGVFGARDNAR